MKLVSLKDYLGRAAGEELGLMFYHVAKERGILPAEVRMVRTRAYCGKVNLYDYAVIDDIFSNELKQYR